MITPRSRRLVASCQSSICLAVLAAVTAPPTRASLLTGRHHLRLRVLSTTGGLEVVHDGAIGLHH